MNEDRSPEKAKDFEEVFSHPYGKNSTEIPLDASNSSYSHFEHIHLNKNVYRGVHYPSAAAVDIAREALSAAESYYNLFFNFEKTANKKNGACENPVTSKPCGNVSAFSQPSEMDEPLTIEVKREGEETGGANELLCNDVEAALKKQEHDETEKDAADEDNDSNNNDEMSSATTVMPIDSPFHTFYPPVLSRRHRRMIINTILHKDKHTKECTPFSSWKWRKDESYHHHHHLSTGNTHHATNAGPNGSNVNTNSSAVGAVGAGKPNVPKTLSASNIDELLKEDKDSNSSSVRNSHRHSSEHLNNSIVDACANNNDTQELCDGGEELRVSDKENTETNEYATGHHPSSIGIINTSTNVSSPIAIRGNSSLIRKGSGNNAHMSDNTLSSSPHDTIIDTEVLKDVVMSTVDRHEPSIFINSASLNTKSKENSLKDAHLGFINSNINNNYHPNDRNSSTEGSNTTTIMATNSGAQGGSGDRFSSLYPSLDGMSDMNTTNNNNMNNNMSLNNGPMSPTSAAGGGGSSSTINNFVLESAQVGSVYKTVLEGNIHQLRSPRGLRNHSSHNSNHYPRPNSEANVYSNVTPTASKDAEMDGDETLTSDVDNASIFSCPPQLPGSRSNNNLYTVNAKMRASGTSPTSKKAHVDGASFSTPIANATKALDSTLFPPDNLAESMYTVPASLLGPRYTFHKEATDTLTAATKGNGMSSPSVIPVGDHSKEGAAPRTEKAAEAEKTREKLLNLISNKKVTFIDSDDYIDTFTSAEAAHNAEMNSITPNRPFRASIPNRDKLVIIMAGLPARGKTFLAQKICRLLGWQGFGAKVQNIQIAWRKVLLEYAESMKKVEEMKRNYCSENTNSAFCTHAASTLRSENSEETESINESLLKGCVTAQQFKRLLYEPESMERRLYLYVLNCFAEDAHNFFVSGGNVVVVNDDFVTKSLREEAEKRFSNLGCEFFYMEVLRDDDQSKLFNEFKINDIAEYPRSHHHSKRNSNSGNPTHSKKDEFPDRTKSDPITSDTPSHDRFEQAVREDFEERLQILKDSYETVDEARPDELDYEDWNYTATDADGDDDHACDAKTASVNSTRKRIEPYVKVRNGHEVEAHRVQGYLGAKIISFAMNLSQVKIQHPIYFVRHGESCYNIEDRIGGNPLLTRQGMRDAAALLEFLDSLQHYLAEEEHHHIPARSLTSANGTNIEVPNSCGACESSSVKHVSSPCTSPLATASVTSAVSQFTTSSTTIHNNTKHVSNNNLEIWTSQLRRAIQTAELSERLLYIKTVRWSSLNEIHGGVCEDMTYEEVKEKYPLIYRFRKINKYAFRYPEGESYQDLVARLEPVIMELENSDKTVVVVAHQAVLRCLLAYFGSSSAERCVEVEVPHRTVWRCIYNAKGIARLEELYLDNTEAGF